MASSTKFIHEAISSTNPQIRLLDVLPGHGAIRCEMHHVSLDKKPDYEALSYCWGTLTRKKRIFINGSSFWITRNLHAALERLRLKDRPRTLWIDAICINQDSVDEKNIFLPMMRDIYQGSRRTIIWLGEHDSRTKGALEMLEFVASKYDEWRPQVLASNEWKKVKRGQKARNSTWLMRMRDQYDSLDAIRTLDSIFSRSWFERTWTIQELVVGADPLVVCGRFQISWETIYRAWFACREDLWQVETIRYLVDLRKTWQEREGSGVLFEIMMKSWHNGVTDEKDKIYGLLGLISSHHLQVIPVAVDYGADTGQVFVEFTRNCISTTKELDVLSVCSGYKASRWPDAPSWALHCRPDRATEPAPDISLGFSLAKKARPYNAGTWPLKTFEFSKNGKLLGLVGLELDIITGVSIMEDIAFISAYLDAKRLWNADDSQIYPLGDQSIHEASRLTIFALQHEYPVAWDEEEERSSHADFKYFDDLSGKAGSWGNSKTVWPRFLKLLISEYLSENSRFEGFYERSRFTDHRRGILSNSGYIGLGPREIEVGDKIVLLQGSRAPMVVRQEAQSLRMVGECYVHSVMNGEAFDESKAAMMWFD
ncbi:heterokaryon incompatibility protein-domain-containing protein [Nemania abortiva]|nr:heterokaryon incompatibility protein-domain-containing protein [Nemania abortiva]